MAELWRFLLVIFASYFLFYLFTFCLLNAFCEFLSVWIYITFGELGIPFSVGTSIHGFDLCIILFLWQSLDLLEVIIPIGSLNSLLFCYEIFVVLFFYELVGALGICFLFTALPFSHFLFYKPDTFRGPSFALPSSWRYSL